MNRRILVAVPAASMVKASALTGDTPQPDSLIPCTWFVDFHTTDSTRIIETHNHYNADFRWSYGGGADSDIDVGIDYSGNGGWTIDGTVHIGQTDGAEIFGTTGEFYDAFVRTNFRYLHGHYGPIGDYCPGPFGTKKVYSVDWWGGISDDNGALRQSCLNNPNRGTYRIGQGLIKNSSRALKVGFAVGMPGGIRLGQTSGYSTRVDMSWTVTEDAGLFLCGRDGPATSSPGVIWASNAWLP